jgi:integrase
MKAAADRRAADTNRELSPFLFPVRRVARRNTTANRGEGAPDRRQAPPGHMVEIKGSWAAICKLAQLSGVRVHDLRHTYASVLASAGLSLPVIGALLGHTQPGTTARYAHLFDDPLRAATERVGAIVTGNGGDKPAGDVVALNRR